MSDSNDTPRERKPLGLKRSVDAGEVKQTFSHGRTNKVVVEVKRRRVLGKPGSEAVSDATTKDGVQIVSICQRRVMASARKGLEEARAEIARDKDIPEDTRKQLLRTLDGQIARWSDKEG